jgi:UDP-glucose 4-epimerase
MGLLRDGGTPTIYGDGRQTRDYVYVGDVAAATLAAETHPGGVFNVGTGIETSVIELAEMLGRAAGEHPRVEFAPKRAGELARSVLAAEKAAERLGWRAAMPLERGLAETYAWFAARRAAPAAT